MECRSEGLGLAQTLSRLSLFSLVLAVALSFPFWEARRIDKQHITLI